ncbi:MAG: DUF2207 domain-containing protein, partial [Bacteroidales bacterium]|nr:DUF2207 domain-containing protein [Bacteroidales bacterium]
MLRRVALSICVLLAFALQASAGSIRSISINVSLDREGSAHFTEIWDIHADDGTEWYLVKSNLRNMSVRDFSVSENGVLFTDDGEWNVRRSLSQKAGKYGIVRGKDGVELCWGLGSMGDHVFTVRYTITGAVQTLRDYDMLHMQLVSPGLSSRPEKVSVKISAEGVPLSADNCRIWGFGFEGNASLEDGQAVYRSTERFRSKSSVIALLRFDKGIFYSPNALDRDFNDVLSYALEGSSYDKKAALGEEDEGDDIAAFAMVIMALSWILTAVLLVIIAVKAHYKSILGVPSMKNIDWCRDVPYGGDVLEGEFVWRKLRSGAAQDSQLAGAMILRMVEKGWLSVSRDPRDKVEFHFNDQASFDELPASYKGLYDMMKEASGADVILQDKEFSRWSGPHYKRVNKWCISTSNDAMKLLKDHSFMMSSGRFTDEGKQEARTLAGFYKFLKDFTLVGERTTREVGLWNDYLVFGMIFGIADKIAKELADIDPKVFSETVYADPTTARQIIWMTRRMGYAITNASASAQMKTASGGFGGATSFGGGGGFSGGG